MSSVAFMNDKRESFDKLGGGHGEDFKEDEKFKAARDVSIPKPICAKKEEWLANIIRRCSIVYNFRDDPIDDIEEKTESLEDLSDFFREGPGPMSRRIYSEIFKMFSVNLFRKIPQNTKRNYDPEEESHTLEESWPHLRLVYEIFIQFLEMSNLRLDYSKIYMTDRFVHEILELMDSDDPREKNMARTVVHRMYTRFFTMRPQLRKELNNILLRFIYETEYFSGICEILEIYSCIINGLSLPLSEEFVTFLSKILVPLHKVKNLSTFHHQLTICLINYLNKDDSTLKIIIEGLVKYWPKTNSQKEVQFLTEIEEMLEVVDSEWFSEVQVTLFTQVGKCVLSPQFQVVEKALGLFNNEYVWQLVEEHHTTVLPVILPYLVQMRRGHWNQTVSVLVNNLLKKYRALDPSFFEISIQDLQEKLKAEEERKKALKLKQMETLQDEQVEEEVSNETEDQDYFSQISNDDFDVQL